MWRIFISVFHHRNYRKITTTKIESMKMAHKHFIFQKQYEKRHTNMPHAFNDSFFFGWSMKQPKRHGCEIIFHFLCCCCCYYYVNVIRLDGVVYKMKVSTWHEFHTKSRVSKHLGMIFFSTFGVYINSKHTFIHSMCIVLAVEFCVMATQIPIALSLHTSLLPFWLLFTSFLSLFLSYFLSFLFGFLFAHVHSGLYTTLFAMYDGVAIVLVCTHTHTKTHKEVICSV